MDAQSAAASVLGSLDSLLLLLGDPVQDRLFCYEKRQPGSIQRSLLRTQGRLTSKLEHQDNAHLKVMMLGPVADSLARRIGEIADPESGVLSIVNFRLNRVSESLRESALAARGRVATQLIRAQTLTSSRTNLQSTHAGLMGRLSGDVKIDQQVRREITDVENQMASVHREENQILEALREEASALRQRIDAQVQMLGNFARLGLINRAPQSISQDSRTRSPDELTEDRSYWEALMDSLEDQIPDAAEREKIIEDLKKQIKEFGMDNIAQGQYITPALWIAGKLGFGSKWGGTLLKDVSWTTLRDFGRSGNWRNLLTVTTEAPINTLRHVGRSLLGKDIPLARVKKGFVLGPGAGKFLGVIGIAWDAGKEFVGEFHEKKFDGRTTTDSTAHAAADTSMVIAGGWAGMKVGAAGGAAVGSIFPGPGTAIGGIVGGIVGGAVGLWTAKKVGDSDIIEDSIDSGLNWVRGR